MQGRSMDLGVLVAADRAQEWLLPWWWENYREENDLPVCFIDLGMSREKRSWCRQRGALFSVKTKIKVARKEQIDPFFLKSWEQSLSPFWDSRAAWFKKPFALLKTPFDRTLWLDLDCEVLTRLNEVFDYLANEVSLLKIREIGEGYSLYNSGVIIFKKNAKLLRRWAEYAKNKNQFFLSDQDALSDLIFREHFCVGRLPDVYNWQMCRGLYLSAKILHWSAKWGKEYIKKYGGLKEGFRFLERTRGNPHPV